MNRNVMRQAQQLQAKLAKAQEELATLTVEGSAGGGAVKVTMNGHLQVVSVKIAPEVVDPAEVGLLEDMVLAALKQAQEEAQKLAAQHLGALTGGLKIPGLF